MAPPRELFLARISAAASFWAGNKRLCARCAIGSTANLEDKRKPAGIYFSASGDPLGAKTLSVRRTLGTRLNSPWNLDDVWPREPSRNTEIDTTKGVELQDRDDLWFGSKVRMCRRWAFCIIHRQPRSRPKL